MVAKMVTKIPKDAKRVFKGVIFDVYHWRQKMFDGTYETFERLRRPDTVLIIPIKGKRIILAKESQPRKKAELRLVGGRVDEGENILAAAKRELLEETGMTSDDWEHFETYDPVDKMEWRVHYFLARGCVTRSAQKLDAGERITLSPVTFDEFMRLASSKEFKSGEFTADILRMRLDKNALLKFKKRLFKKRLFKK